MLSLATQMLATYHYFLMICEPNSFEIWILSIVYFPIISLLHGLEVTSIAKILSLAHNRRHRLMLYEFYSCSTIAQPNFDHTFAMSNCSAPALAIFHDDGIMHLILLIGNTNIINVIYFILSYSILAF